MNVAIADTSFVLAVGNQKEILHRECVAVFNAHEKIYLPQSTLAEIGYMLGSRGGNRAVVHFLYLLPTMHYEVTPLHADDLQRTAEMMDKYADSRLDFVDVTIAAMAERLNATRILTLDQRDFQILRPKHIDHFELLPQ